MQNIGQNQKTYCRTSNTKMENNRFERVRIKNLTHFYFDYKIKFKDLNFDDILIDKKVIRKYFDL